MTDFSRRQFLGTAGAALATRSGAAQATPPNIVFIYADDLDFDELEPYPTRQFPCYTGAKLEGRYLPRKGNPAYDDPRMLTPHISRIANEGVTFSRFYVTTSICTPSRYSTLTGRFASRSPGFCRTYPPGTHATIQWNTPIDPSESNIAKELGKAGYTTGMVGKWHNGQQGGKSSSLAPDADPESAAVQRTIRENHEAGLAYLRQNTGFDYVDRIYFGNKEEMGLPKQMQVHNLEWVAEGALRFIDENKSRPFFLYSPLTTPHGQYSANWLRDNPRYCPAGVLESAPEVMPPRESVFERLRAMGINERNAPATWIDDYAGTLMARLEQLGIADNTLFIFASDHQSRGKYCCYEGSRVPLMARWPKGIRAGLRVDALTANVDLPATFLELAGAAAPADMSEDGSSFASVLQGEPKPSGWRDTLLLECSNIRAVVGEQWKYVANRVDPKTRKALDEDARKVARKGGYRRVDLAGRPSWHDWQEGVVFNSNLDFPHYFDDDQLYDLEVDVFEQDNLAGDSAYRNIMKEMQELMAGHLKRLPHTFGEWT